MVGAVVPMDAENAPDKLFLPAERLEKLPKAMPGRGRYAAHFGTGIVSSPSHKVASIRRRETGRASECHFWL
jgi:hypothetical protein